MPYLSIILAIALGLLPFGIIVYAFGFILFVPLYLLYLKLQKENSLRKLNKKYLRNRLGYIPRH